MAPSTRSQRVDAPIASNEESDYGSDFEEATIERLLSQSALQPAIRGVVEIVEPPELLDDHGDDQPLARLAYSQQNASQAIAGINSTRERLSPTKLPREASIEIEYDESNRSSFSPSRPKDEEQHREREMSVSLEQGRPDTRTPLERFRTLPKKPLSVTDLVTPAWCELQYWYSLTKYGRVRRTPAMKQGSSVHKVLEEQTLGPAVEITTVSKEDRFGLRIWNIIQRLQTLRRTGVTREMEIWGVVDGQVVNGVIDEINVTCPDEMLEAQMLEEADQAKQQGGKSRTSKPMPANQQTLTAFLTGSSGGSVLERNDAWLGPLREKQKTLYLVDIKTRQSNSLPQIGSQLRPTQMQLMMYHRLFSTLAANDVPAERVFERYSVDPNATFSDAFIAELGSLGSSFDSPAGSDGASQDTFSVLLAHTTLSTLWSLMITEFTTIVHSTAFAISPLLTAEFRAARDGTLIGKRSFALDAERLDAYVADEMKWWKGERETKGVEVEEAFKCRMCEFAEGCTWRATKLEESIQKARLRNITKRRSEV